ncbi:hypothetical protein Ciccas_011298 [Cichlidogyrus casuarinus]|uniref:Potassium channel domain-containing protein n=1 Tax=Cichlidogyrus casuarinus TaxID=1844966 RepID=A0ABD2PRN6_9PLAT
MIRFVFVTGYGYAVPKTNMGRMVTILYALVGLPLVFLYLSNIGDYLADIFRILYTRTCQRPCERFCSPAGYSFLYKRIILLCRGDVDANSVFDDSECGSQAENNRKQRRRVLLNRIGEKSSDEQRKALLQQMIDEGFVPPINVFKDTCQDPSSIDEQQASDADSVEDVYSPSQKTASTTRSQRFFRYFCYRRKLKRHFSRVNTTMVCSLFNP